MQKWELHLSDAKIHFKLLFWDCKILSEKLCRSFLCHRADLIQITRLFSVHSSPFWAMLRRTKQAKTNREANRTCRHAQGSIHLHQTRTMPRAHPQWFPGRAGNFRRVPVPRTQHDPCWGLNTIPLGELDVLMNTWDLLEVRHPTSKQAKRREQPQHLQALAIYDVIIGSGCRWMFPLFIFPAKKKFPELEASCSNPSRYKTSKFHEK